MSTLIVFIVEKLGGLLELAIRIGSVAHGPLLGLFVLGALFPKANSKVMKKSFKSELFQRNSVKIREHLLEPLQPSLVSDLLLLALIIIEVKDFMNQDCHFLLMDVNLLQPILRLIT